MLIGLLTFFWPPMTALLLLDLIAIWAIVLGVFDVVVAFASQQPAGREILLILAGVLSLLFAALRLLHPVAAALGLVWMIGVYAIMLGILWLIGAFRFRARVHA
jgi:uncharacterized membrane protein HdeD (DUF308 family)